MSSAFHSRVAAARDREKAAARSAQLTDLFGRLATADERARRGSTEVDDADVFGGAGSPGPSERARNGREQRKRTAAPSLSPTLSPPRPQNGAVFFHNGRALVLSPASRRLPPAFYEQTRVVGSVEVATTEVQRTLLRLHRDLAVHGRQRSNSHSTPHSSNNKTRAMGRERHSGSGAMNASDSSGSAPGDFDAPATTTAAAQRRIAAEEAKVEKMRVQRARAAAADEGASDVQSVEDYGVDCEIPPLTGESRVEAEVAAVADHFAKAKTSALAMAEVEELAPTTSAAPWWSSALRLRDMKAAAARLDYHARAALGRSYRAREQLLLQVAHLNNVSAATRTQLLQQQQRWQEFQTRLRDGQQAMTQLQAAIAQRQAQTQEQANHRAKLQEELLLRAQETAVVDAAETNLLKAELALLLAEREWPSRSLQRDAQTVLEWLRHASTPLE
ncbi:hypothetical protein ABB37_08954 [Leptomonas pyrrhocoris]|uniref:Uncharacterized protein n=1 Tax=Leptomonas pyrrhocoris TaxID=157538 RepID=A0A0M9FQG3_LEPPY|nr:hypothetical protein ABB37_09693 [Leptomonas pyrrhocoris]XP_015652257.1 hypothetical protein ABB37_09693 [Leptomonas pyrrhocoris]XP_015652258.1 hypothetical protein ABB37_09693 [Leptomonas pyrrhocoris]XP_015653437.1 hypothetical protein ABB37_08954 [Leptomonas pyrrhocoris]XP_015653438.1 hypothetical protein ABB37_08954 [Leptomonas pyrrhocoris]KPA73817.1 hypothetical protein ABB37_09693 [Leptomonas pyrrhocoris]KPA73818.1 hypothetical protein ABB37_09693 [Leptomonas pyrrhocoris]KPA73819.1 h|eukprot:XP_015652256.1 hypothetical protein ABB37_09693 [Leptomonas pyrrhocoris]